LKIGQYLKNAEYRAANFATMAIFRALGINSIEEIVMKKLSLIASIAATSLLVACASTPKPATAPAAASAAKPAAPAASNITGTWSLSVESPMGTREMKLNATQTGETLAGSIASPRGDMPITGTVKGNAVAFMMKVNAQGMDMQIDYKGTVDGDSMKGTAKFGEFGDGTFTGKKQ
jgi:hypothetical protein